MQPLEACEHLLWRVRAPPGAGGVLVCLDQCRIDVNRAEDLVETDAVLHRRDELNDEIARVHADDGRAEDAIASGRGQHLYEAVRCLSADRAVQLSELEDRRLVFDAAILCLYLVQS